MAPGPSPSPRSCASSPGRSGPGWPASPSSSWPSVPDRRSAGSGGPPGRSGSGPWPSSAWGLLWVGEAGWSPVALPAPEVLLAPAAAGIAMAAGLAAVVLRAGCRSARASAGARSAWSSAWSPCSSASGPFLAAAGQRPLVPAPQRLRPSPSASCRPRRRTPPSGSSGSATPTCCRSPGWRLTEDTAYATSDNGLPDVTELFPGSTDGGTEILAEALRTATRRETNRLGDLLGPDGHPLRRGARAPRPPALRRGGVPARPGGPRRPLQPARPGPDQREPRGDPLRERGLDPDPRPAAGLRGG